jgi:hypothetical protein
MVEISKDTRSPHRHRVCRELLKGLRELLLGLVVVLTPLGAALSGGGRAHADTSQGAYLAALNKVAVPGTAAQQLRNGHVICEALDSHQDVVTVLTGVAPRAGLTIDWSAYMVGAAIRWLCPEQTWQIKELDHADQTIPGVTSAILGFQE